VTHVYQQIAVFSDERNDKSCHPGTLTLFCHGNNLFNVDVSLIEELIVKNKPFRVETAAGRVFEVPHRDFVSFSPRKTSLIISYEEDGKEHFAVVPLLTVTSAMAAA
jgi:hypothetical protein